jgi:hypothetical protein
MATGYGLDDPASITGCARFLSSPQRPERHWGPPSLLANGYQRLTTHLHPPPLPNTPSWHSASLVKHRDNFTFYYYYFKHVEKYRRNRENETLPPMMMMMMMMMMILKCSKTVKKLEQLVKACKQQITQQKRKEIKQQTELRPSKILQLGVRESTI